MQKGKKKKQKIDLNSWRFISRKKTTCNWKTMDSQERLTAYYAQLTPFEQRTCDIARDHLGSSFDLARSNGFIRWLKDLG